MSMISITAHDGGSFQAYIARPENTPAPVVIVIQEIFGINQELRDKCHELAAQGYIAVCPDLFWRIEPGIELVDSVPEQLQRAFDLYGQFDVKNGIADLKSTLDQVRKLDGSNGKVGCTGYCLGGKLAFMMATHSDIDASVSYYGVAIETMLDDSANIKAPLLMHIAENDQFVPPEAQAQIKGVLSDNPHVEIHSYPGADHAFARGNGMHYNEAAATLANGRTKTFLKDALK